MQNYDKLRFEDIESELWSQCRDHLLSSDSQSCFGQLNRLYLSKMSIIHQFIKVTFYFATSNEI